MDDGHWYRMDLGDAQLADPEIGRVADRFEAFARGAARADSLAVFVRHETERHLHCHAVLYFPPGLAALARECGATPCARPPAHGLGLVAGASGAREALFPGEPT